MKIGAAPVVASLFLLASNACNGLIGTENRFFDASDATTLGDDTGNAGDGASGRTGLGDAASVDSASFDATVDGQAKTDSGSGENSAADSDSDSEAPTCTSDAGLCPLPAPLLTFPSVATPILTFDADPSWLYVAFAGSITAIKKYSGTEEFTFWTADGTHQLVDLQVFDKYVYLLETDTQANEQYLFKCPILSGTSPAACLASSSLMTMDKAAGMYIPDDNSGDIYWYGPSVAWQATLEVNNSGGSRALSGAVGIDLGAGNLYVASSNGLYRLPTSPFGSQVILNSNSESDCNSVASDTSYVYCANGTTNSIYVGMASFANDSTAPTPIATKQGNPVALQIAGSTLYWLNKGTSAGGSAIMACATPDCGDEPAVVVQQYFNQPTTMRVKSGDAFYVQDVDTSGTSPRQVIYRIPHDF